MARLISELTAAGAITPASDLLWLEQGGLPRKLTVAALSAALTPTYQLANNQFLQGENLAGGTFYDLIGINTADWVEIGEPTRNVQYDGTLHKFSSTAEHYAPAGGQSHLIRTTTNWTSGTLFMPGVRWQENDGTSHAGIRAYTTNGTNSFLTLGTGWLDSKLTLGSGDAHTMNGNLTIIGSGNELELQSVAPKLRFHETDAAANTQEWDIVATGGTLLYRIRGDGDVGGETYMTVTRTTTTSTALDFNADTINIDTANYMDFDSANTVVGIRFRTSGTQRGYLYADANGIGILNDGGGWSLRHNHSGDSITIVGVLYPNNQTVGNIQAVSGNYGSVQCGGADGSSGTWSGWSIDGRFVFMGHPTEQRCGIYDDVDNVWAIQWNHGNAASNEELALYCRNGTSSAQAAITQGYTATGKTTGMRLIGHDGGYRDVGWNVLPIEVTNASATLAAQHCGQVIYSNNTTTYTVTTPANTSTDFPVGGMCTIMNLNATGNININAGSGVTIYWLNGQTSSGNRVLGNYGIANIWRHSSAAFFVWGSGLS